MDLLAASQKSNWKVWPTFFLNGVRQQSEDALVTAQNLLALKEEYKEIAVGPKVPKSMNLLIDKLFGDPIVSNSELSKEWGCRFRQFSAALITLLKRASLGK